MKIKRIEIKMKDFEIFPVRRFKKGKYAISIDSDRTISFLKNVVLAHDLDKKYKFVKMSYFKPKNIIHFEFFEKNSKPELLKFCKFQPIKRITVKERFFSFFNIDLKKAIGTYEPFEVKLGENPCIGIHLDKKLVKRWK